QDLNTAGLFVWLDIEKMTGNMNAQMQDNVKNSQYVLLIGTERYAQRTQLATCDLLRSTVLPEGAKDRAWVSTLPITAKTAYVRTGDKLYYVNKTDGLVHIIGCYSRTIATI